MTMDESIPVQNNLGNDTVLERLRAEVRKVIIGQESFLDSVLITLLCRGHLLVEGVPGLAKTLTLRTFAGALDLDFKRIQFTPDLLPADVTGTRIFNPRDLTFVIHQGPIFANLVLADEINRAPAKVQSALLEAMQERQVTIAGCTLALDDPFMVMATQNPIETEGTYPLPEAQMDRFLMKIIVGYPTEEDEIKIVELNELDRLPEIKPVVSKELIRAAISAARAVHLDPKLRRYAVMLAAATRNLERFRLAELSPYIRFGASPRAPIALCQCAKAMAFLRGRGHVLPQDIKALAFDVMRHRILLSYEAEASGITPAQIIDRILLAVPVP